MHQNENNDSRLGIVHSINDSFKLRRIVSVEIYKERFIWTLGCGHHILGMCKPDIGTLIQCFHCI